jgi:hypothetical protein
LEGDIEGVGCLSRLIQRVVYLQITLVLAFCAAVLSGRFNCQKNQPVYLLFAAAAAAVVAAFV